MVDTSVAPANFAGPIVSSKFVSAATATTQSPVTAHISLPLVPTADPLPLTVYGAHVEYTYSPTGLTGTLNGAIRKTDIDQQVIPKLADIFNTRIQVDLTGSGLTATDKQILKVFDDGGVGKGDSTCPSTAVAGGTPMPACRNHTFPGINNPGRCAKAGDKVIDECEVASSPIIPVVFQPDVQLFAADGVTWMPNPNATANQKDSLSLGIQFSAVPATF
jgi:hypothetical protein